MQIDFTVLTLLLPACVMLHVTEEFLFPGGFIDWYKEFRPALAAGIKPGYIVWINTLMMAVCILPLHWGLRFVSAWYIVSAIAAANACFHIIGVVVLKKYSPGVITGVLLYLPLFGYASWYLLSTGELSVIRAVIAVAIGVGYHVFEDRGHKVAAAGKQA